MSVRAALHSFTGILPGICVEANLLRQFPSRRRRSPGGAKCDGGRSPTRTGDQAEEAKGDVRFMLGSPCVEV
jgi:hypothetical protein